MKYVITYHTSGDSIQTETIQAESLEDAIEILIADEHHIYCYGQFISAE